MVAVLTLHLILQLILLLEVLVVAFAASGSFNIIITLAHLTKAIFIVFAEDGRSDVCVLARLILLNNHIWRQYTLVASDDLGARVLPKCTCNLNAEILIFLFAVVGVFASEVIKELVI